MNNLSQRKCRSCLNSDSKTIENTEGIMVENRSRIGEFGNDHPNCSGILDTELEPVSNLDKLFYESFK
ncbi:9511_t:CDS:2, partial [Entrophospora sp. SA101]